MLKFVRKHSQPIGGHPLTDTLFLHIAWKHKSSQPIGDHPLWPYPLRVVSNCVRHSYIYIYIYLFTGWWFGTFLFFSIIYGIILPIDFHFFSEGQVNHQAVDVDRSEANVSKQHLYIIIIIIILLIIIIIYYIYIIYVVVHDLLLVLVFRSGDQWKAALLHLESLDKVQLEGNVITEGSVLASGGQCWS